MSHEYKCCTIFFCCIQGIKTCSLNCFCCDRFCNCLLVLVYSGSICSNLTEQRLSYCNRAELILILFNCFYQFIILCTMHQMCWLYNQIYNTVINCTLQCLIHIVDYFAISCLNMVDDDLCCKCSSDRPVRISFC